MFPSSPAWQVDSLLLSHLHIFFIHSSFDWRWKFSGGSVVKNQPSSAGASGDMSSIHASRRSPRGEKWQSTPVFLPGESHGVRNLTVYRTWGHKELDTTKHACMFNWHLGCSHVLAIANSAAMSSTGFIYHFRPCFSLNIYPGVGLLVEALFLVLKKPSFCAT